MQLRWNDQGYICAVPREDAQALYGGLGITTLSIREFMALARREPRVASSVFAEWLTDLYTLGEEGQCFDSRGELVEMPTAKDGNKKIGVHLGSSKKLW